MQGSRLFLIDFTRMTQHLTGALWSAPEQVINYLWLVALQCHKYCAFTELHWTVNRSLSFDLNQCWAPIAFDQGPDTWHQSLTHLKVWRAEDFGLQQWWFCELQQPQGTVLNALHTISEMKDWLNSKYFIITTDGWSQKCSMDSSMDTTSHYKALHSIKNFTLLTV